MNDFTNLEYYNLILIRYTGEIWLKSTKVKIRMIKTLMENIKSKLKHSSIPFHKYQMSNDSSRIFFFFKNEDIPQALHAIGQVFGIYSVSPALRTSSALKNITEKTLNVAEKVLENGDSFALRVRRSGNQEFTSKDIAIKVGQAVMDTFSELNLKVNLSSPKKKIYIEVRDDFSYIFTDIIKNTWGGLPIEGRKKILIMDVGRLNDLLAGFLLMRRGAMLYPILFDLCDNKKEFEKRISNWEETLEFASLYNFMIIKINLTELLEYVSNKLDEKGYFCAICRLVRFDIISRLLKMSDLKIFEGIRAISDGISLNSMTFCDDNVDLESIALNPMFSEYPIFTPVVGLDSKNIKKFLSNITESLKTVDYCRFKPTNQGFDLNEVKSLYLSLDLDDKLEDCLNKSKELNRINNYIEKDI